MELRAQLDEELQQLYQLRWEQGHKPREIREHFGWSVKQYEKRDAKLKSAVVTAIERSAPDSIVPGRGDGSACRELRDLLPLLLRKPKRLAADERRRMDAHLLACDSCRLAAQEARRVIETVRPEFVPVDSAVIGVSTGGGLLAKVAGLLGLGGGGGASAMKLAAVAGCAGAVCFAGKEVLPEPPSPEPKPETSVAASRPIKDESVDIRVVRTPPPAPQPKRTSARRSSTASTAKPRQRTTASRPPQEAVTMLVDPSTRASEFSPEAPPAAVANAPARQPAAPVNPAPAGAAGGAEFAGP